MVFVSVVLILSHPFGPLLHVVLRWTRIGSVVGKAGKDSGDVLPNQPGGPESSSQLEIREGQVSSGVGQSSPEPSETKGLTRRSSHKEVDGLVVALFDRGEIAMTRHIRISGFEHGPREGLDLGEERRAPPQRVPRDGGGLDAGAHGAVDERSCHLSAGSLCQ